MNGWRRIGDVRDDDDDDDGILDTDDDSPASEGYLDDDGDGVVNRLDTDIDGNDSDALEGVRSGEVDSLAMVVREPECCWLHSITRVGLRV